MRGKRIFKRISAAILVMALVLTMQGFSEMGTIVVRAEGDDVASVTIGSETTSYATFADAWSAANGKTATLTLLKDFSLSINSSRQYSLTSGSVLLELNGHTITASYSADNYTVLDVSGGELTIKGMGGITSANNGTPIYINAGTLNIYSGNFTSTQADANCRGLLTWNGSGTVNIYGGTFTGYVGFRPYGVGSTIKLYGGTFVGSKNAISTYGYTVGSLLAEGYVYMQNGTEISEQAVLDSSALPAGTVTVKEKVTSLIDVAIGYTSRTTATATITVTGADITGYTLTDTTDSTHTYTSTDGQFTGLAFGNYALVVTDSVGKEWTKAVTISAPVAEVNVDGNSSYFNYFSDAWSVVQKAESATISLLQDVELGLDIRLLLSQGDVVFETGTYTLKGMVIGYGLIGLSGGKLVINGNGTMQNTKGNCIDLTGGTLIINGGNYQAEDSDLAVSVAGGDLTIHGGYFKGYKAIFDKSSTPCISLSGGTFEGIDYAIVSLQGDVTRFPIMSYGYQKSDGSWIMGEHPMGLKDRVTVRETPIVSIGVSSDKDSVSYQYETSDAPTLTALVTKAAGYAASQISYQWYAITENEGNITETWIDGATSDTYTVPAGLSIGTHSYRVKATVDGYGTSADVSLMVEMRTPSVNDFVYTAPTNLMYDGNEKEATVIPAEGVNGLGTITLNYQKDGETVTAPKEAGTYTVHVTTTDGTIYKGVTNLEIGTFTIVKTEQSTLSIQEVTGKKYGDGTFTLTTSGGSGTGGVTYSVPDGNGVLSINGDTATIIGAGSVTVTATKAEDNTYNSTQTTREITISKTTPTITVDTNVYKNMGSRQVTLTVTMSPAGTGANPSGAVRFVDCTNGSDADIAGATAVTILGSQATYTWTGLTDQIYKIKAVYSGDANYNTTTSEVYSFDASKQDQSELRIEKIDTKTYGDSAFTLTSTGGTGDGVVTFTSSDENIVSISGSTATIHKAGTVKITATKAEDNTYKEANATVSLTVQKKALTIKADDKLSLRKAVAMPDLTYTVTGLVGSDSYTGPTISTTAIDTSTPGEYDITLSGGALDHADSYEVTYLKGRLTVIKASHDVTVSNGSGSGSYIDGRTVTITANNRNGYTFTGWSSSEGIIFANPAASTTTFTMPDQAVTVTANYKEKKAGLENAAISGITSLDYTGDAMEQSKLVVMVNGTTLVNGKDYDTSYQNNQNIGTATITITGKGSYQGTIEKNFEITVRRNRSYMVNNLNYRITNAATNGTGTVTVIGSLKSKTKLAGSLTIGDTVMIGGKSFLITTIGDKAFQGYTKLTKISMGKRVVSIGKQAFAGCTKLTAVTLGSSVKAISDQAFYKCINLKKVTIPAKVKKIGKQAFYGCKKLKSITIRTTGLTSKKVGTKAFSGIYAKASVKVPKNKLAAYRTILLKKGVSAKAKIKK